MDVNRILRLADALYGDDTRRRIFEPLVADLQRELALHPKLTLRWRIAVLAAFVQCLPRALTLPMPRGLWFDVAIRVAGFSALAFALQQLMNGRPGTGTRSWPEIAALSLSFAVIPAVWRIRTSPLPDRERQVDAGLFVAMVAVVQASFGEGGWVAQLALAAGAPVLALFGWKLHDAERERMSPLAANLFIRIVMVAAALTLASVPFQLALGIRPWDAPRSQQFISYLLAALVVGTAGRGSAGTRSPGTRSRSSRRRRSYFRRGL
jgi:hypothetical protein